MSYPMVLNSVFVGMLDLRTDQIKYFNIPDATTAELALAQTTTSGSNYTKNVYSNRLDSTTPTRQVQVDRTQRTKTRRKTMLGRGGKAISIPTELKTSPPAGGTTNPGNTIIKRETIRFTTIRFPGAADLSEISAWLHVKLVAHKPKFMKSPAGSAYPIAPFPTGNVATGGNTTP